MSECPNQTFSLFNVEANEIMSKYKNSLICRYNIEPTINNIKQLISDNKCAQLYLKSEPFGGRCIPSLLTISGHYLKDEIRNTSLETQNGQITLDFIKATNK